MKNYHFVRVILYDILQWMYVIMASIPSWFNLWPFMNTSMPNAFDYLMSPWRYREGKNIHRIPLPRKQPRYVVYSIFNPLSMLLLRIRIIMGTTREQLVARVPVILIYIKSKRTAIIYHIPCIIIITSYFTVSKISPFQHEGDWDVFEGWWWGDDNESSLENLMPSMALGIQIGAKYLVFKIVGLMILH